MQIHHPVTRVPEDSINPPVSANMPLSTAQRQQLVIESVLEFTENYVGQPGPYPLEDELSEHSHLAYSHYDINSSASPRLEHGEALQLRLEGDIMLTAAQCNPFTLATCDSLLQGLATQQALAERMLDSKVQLLKLLQEMTCTMFRQHTLDGQQLGSTVTLSPETRDAFKSLDLDIAELASPAQAYARISGKWVDMERSITEEGLLVLALRLQVLRLGLYRSAGQYLSDLAQTLISHHLVDEDWVGPGEVHRGGAMLKRCVEDPFLSRWPNMDWLTQQSGSDEVDQHGK